MRGSPITVMALVVFSIFLVPHTWAQSGDAQSQAERFIQKNDHDGDGKLSMEEFPNASAQLFRQIDSDNDGLVSITEDAAFRARRSRRSGGQRGLPDGVSVMRDLVYARVGDRELKLDLYLPKTSGEKLPVIVWVHGGGWKNGSKGNGGRALGMTSRGYAVVDVDYRLSGEAIWPAQIADCKAAIRWTRANADKYGLAENRIGAWGSSAGGHLVAMLGTSGGVESFDTLNANPGVSSRVNAVCDWFGPTDFTQMDAHRPKGARLVHNAADSPEAQLVGGPIQAEPYRSICAEANPITYVSGDDPPFLIVHGDNDLLVPIHQSELLHAALTKRGVDSTFHVVKGGGHGFGGATHDTPESLFELSAAFFDKHLKPNDGAK